MSPTSPPPTGAEAEVPSQPGRRPTGRADAVWFAVGTLTRIPVPRSASVDRRAAGRGLSLAPAVGVVAGAVTGLPLLLPGATTPPARLLTAVLAVAGLAWLTRGLHWDGLADTADGLGVGGGADRAQTVMHRSDIGPFGVLTLALAVLLQVAALATVPDAPAAWQLWVLAVAGGRASLAIAASGRWPAARPSGLGAFVVGTVGPLRQSLAAATWLLVAGAAVVHADLPPLAVGLAGVGALVAGVGTCRLATRRLGGINGDTLGAGCECATTAALVGAALVVAALAV